MIDVLNLGENEMSKKLKKAHRDSRGRHGMPLRWFARAAAIAMSPDFVIGGQAIIDASKAWIAAKGIDIIPPGGWRSA